MDGKVITATCH